MAELLIDGDCGFCRTVADWLARRVRPRGVRIVPFQEVDLAELGVTAQRAGREVLWIGKDGGVRGGAEAVAALLRTGGSRWAWLGRVLDAPPVRPIAAIGYRAVARNRYRLSWLARLLREH